VARNPRVVGQWQETPPRFSARRGGYRPRLHAERPATALRAQTLSRTGRTRTPAPRPSQDTPRASSAGSYAGEVAHFQVAKEQCRGSRVRERGKGILRRRTQKAISLKYLYLILAQVIWPQGLVRRVTQALFSASRRLCGLSAGWGTAETQRCGEEGRQETRADCVCPCTRHLGRRGEGEIGLSGAGGGVALGGAAPGGCCAVACWVVRFRLVDRGRSRSAQSGQLCVDLV